MPALAIPPMFITGAASRNKVIGLTVNLSQGSGSMLDDVSAVYLTNSIALVPIHDFVRTSGTPHHIRVITSSVPSNLLIFNEAGTADLEFELVKVDLLKERNSEDEEFFVFTELIPKIKRYGSLFIRRIDALVCDRTLHPLARHYFAYMLSYLDGPLREESRELLNRYRLSDDPWVRTGAEEGADRLVSVSN